MDKEERICKKACQKAATNLNNIKNTELVTLATDLGATCGTDLKSHRKTESCRKTEDPLRKSQQMNQHLKYTLHDKIRNEIIRQKSRKKNHHELENNQIASARTRTNPTIDGNTGRLVNYDWASSDIEQTMTNENLRGTINQKKSYTSKYTGNSPTSTYTKKNHGPKNNKRMIHESGTPLKIDENSVSKSIELRDIILENDVISTINMNAPKVGKKKIESNLNGHRREKVNNDKGEQIFYSHRDGTEMSLASVTGTNLNLRHLNRNISCMNNSRESPRKIDPMTIKIQSSTTDFNPRINPFEQMKYNLDLCSNDLGSIDECTSKNGIRSLYNPNGMKNYIINRPSDKMNNHGKTHAISYDYILQDCLAGDAVKTVDSHTNRYNSMSKTPRNGYSIASNKKENKHLKTVISSKHNMFRMFPTVNTNLHNYKHNIHVKSLREK